MDPDVVGYRFDAAKEKLARHGVTVVECLVTGPQQGRRQRYVIRQREVTEKAIAIVVAYLGSEPPC